MRKNAPSARRPIASLIGSLIACLLLSADRAAALQPDQIALVVNSKAPAGRKLAEFYAQQRHIPDSRIITLDLPDAEEMPFEAYDRDVVPAVRKFLIDNGLKDKVTCLVTFYGVPLRVGRRVATAAQVEEIRRLDADSKEQTTRAKEMVGSIEALAKQFSPGFAPAGGEDLNALFARASAAEQAVVKALSADADVARRGSRFTQMLGPVEVLYGPLETIQRLSQPPYTQLAPRPLAAEVAADARGRQQAMMAALNDAGPRIDDPEARAKVRQVVRDNLGVFRFLQVMKVHRDRIEPSETESAFDSELALLWWKDGYNRHRWQPNPLNYRIKYAPKPPAGPAAAERTLMVTRLDAPTEQVVRDVIVTSIRVEKEGLKGVAALDSRGKAGGDAYGRYDQTIRELGQLIRNRTGLTVMENDAETLFPPRSVRDVALYCGWYSPLKYVPGMVFNPGAVGYHVASSELVSLHGPNETGWVRGLMTDGVVATLGPVAEPYLHSFPPADEFFTFLLTGKLSLAEAYWLSNPLTSWMNACIGDPLYTPYAAKPPLPLADVPPRLHIVFEDDPAQPPTPPR